MLAMVLLCGLATRTAQAAEIEVSNSSDTNVSGSLRYAIHAANESAGADTIFFKLAVSATITLQSALPAITDSVTILGPGVANLTLSGDEQFRVFSVGSSVAVTITDLTIQEGRASNGGAINSQGALTLQHVDLFNNVASQSGGALYSTHPTLAIISSKIYSNVAITGAGGGVYISSESGGTSPTFTSTLVYNNLAGGEGGGIYLQAGNLALQQTKLYYNRAEFGGALYLSALTRLDVIGGEISHNLVSDDGGGLYVKGATYLTATKFLSNYAFDKGGAIFQVSGGTTQATQGCFVNNSNTAVGFIGGSSPLVVSDNWWGYPNGPGGEGMGWGDWVSADVDFGNFKSAAPAGCPDLTPHFSMVKRVQGIPAPNDMVTYTLVISNSGVTDDPDVIITDALPPKINFVSWLEAPADASEANETITFSGPIRAGQIITLSFVAKFVGNHSDQVTNRAFYTGTFDSGSATTTLSAMHLLSVTTTGSGVVE